MGGPETIDPWADVFQVNVIGTMRLTLALLPQIEAGGRKIVSLTSRLGSIGENADGGIAAYRASRRPSTPPCGLSPTRSRAGESPLLS